MPIDPGNWRCTYTANFNASTGRLVDVPRFLSLLSSEVVAATGSVAHLPNVQGNPSCNMERRNLLITERWVANIAFTFQSSGRIEWHAIDRAVWNALHNAGLSGISVNRIVSMMPEGPGDKYIDGVVGIGDGTPIARVNREITATTVSAPVTVTPTTESSILGATVVASGNPANVGQETGNILSNAARGIGGALTEVSDRYSTPLLIAAVAVAAVGGIVAVGYTIRSIK